MFWDKMRTTVQGREKHRREGWNACLDEIEKILAEHAWVSEEEDRGEIFCDTCGESLSRRLKELRKP